MTEGRFQNPLVVRLTGRQKKGRPIWKVEEELVFVHDCDGVVQDIRVPVGFETDFASVPRIFWRFAPPGGLYAGAAVIHDYLYINRVGEELYGKDGARRRADKIFRTAMKAANVRDWRANIIYKAIRTFGGKGWGS